MTIVAPAAKSFFAHGLLSIRDFTVADDLRRNCKTNDATRRNGDQITEQPLQARAPPAPPCSWHASRVLWGLGQARRRLADLLDPPSCSFPIPRRCWCVRPGLPLAGGPGQRDVSEENSIGNRIGVAQCLFAVPGLPFWKTGLQIFWAEISDPFSRPSPYDSAHLS